MSNFYQNPYMNYPYSAYGNQVPNMYQQMPMQQQPQQQVVQPNYLPLTLVDNVEEVKSYIVQPNQVVYLKIRNSNSIYEKSANNQGEYSINEYGKIDNSKPKEEKKVEYATKDMLTALQDDFEEKLDNLSIELKKALKKDYNNKK